MKKILVPFDFSALSMSALRFAIELAEAAQGQVTALHVVNIAPVYLESLDPNGYPISSASILSELSREATQHFARVKVELKTSIEPGFRVEQGLLHQIVIKTIHETEADLVVMGTNGSNGIAEVMMGSNTEKVVLKFATRIPGSMIAMGTHGYTGLTHLMLGSVAENVINHTREAVWTCKLSEHA